MRARRPRRVPDGIPPTVGPGKAVGGNGANARPLVVGPGGRGGGRRFPGRLRGPGTSPAAKPPGRRAMRARRPPGKGGNGPIACREIRRQGGSEG